MRFVRCSLRSQGIGMLARFGRFKEPQSRRDALWLVVLYTAISVTVSAGATALFAQANGWPLASALIPAVLIPFLVAPWMTWTIASYALRLHDMRGELERLARTDPLSGALNRRGLAEFAQGAFEARDKKPLTAIILDIDRFKSINDSCGHAAGDAVIARAVETLRRISGSEECVVGRLGGDELVAFVVGLSLEESMILAERVRDGIEHMTFIHDGRRVTVTASVGVAAADPGDRDAEEMLKRADQSLYAAKSAGRNRVRAAA